MDRHSWCPKCDCYVPNNQVTFDETHDGCGFLVLDRDPEEKASALKDELIAYHDREWMEPHEGLPKHTAGEYPEECSGCAAIAKAKEG